MFIRNESIRKNLPPNLPPFYKFKFFIHTIFLFKLHSYIKGRKRKHIAPIQILTYYSYIQGVSKKGNRTLQCSSAFIIQSIEIIFTQAERPGFWLSIVIIFVKFEERLGKYESNENSRSKSHIFTSEHY